MSNFKNTSLKSTTKLAVPTNKNMHCRSVLCMQIKEDYIRAHGTSPFIETPTTRIRPCTYMDGSCRGAHSNEEIRAYPHIYKYNSTNKATIQWVQLYLQLVKCIESNAPKVLNVADITRLSTISTLNFVQLAHLWRELACSYRKLARELPLKAERVGSTIEAHSSGYVYQEDVPQFYIMDGFEDLGWAFTRLTRMCQTNQTFERALESGSKVTIYDVCLATGLNCKEGVHKLNEFICVDNFLSGHCTCQSKDEFEEKEAIYLSRSIELSAQLMALIDAEKHASTTKDDDEWEMTIVRRGKKAVVAEDPKTKIRLELNRVQKRLEEVQTSRMIHYTEDPINMIPFEEQYRAHLAHEEAKAIKEREEEAKRTCTHDFVNGAKKIGPVIKLKKLGKK